MVEHRPSPTAGEKLRQMRMRLGLTTRDVEATSLQIADERRNREFYISHSWIVDIENGEFTPTIFKIYSLSAIYKVHYSELLDCLGVPLGEHARYRTSLGVPATHLFSGAEPETEQLSMPVQLKRDFRLEKTELLARVVEKWGDVPVPFLQRLDLRKFVYGYIGLEDFTLYPLIRPGSLVQIDANQTKISAEKWKTDFDRPIYFVELRAGYVCSWCQVDRGQLLIIPHPHSHQDVRRFDYPSQAEIVGRVTGVTMRIVEEQSPHAMETVHRGRE